MDPTPATQLPRALMFAVWLFVIIGAFWLLMIGKGFLIPLVFAVLLLYLIEVLTSQWTRIRVGGKSLPEPIARWMSVGVILLALWGLSSVIVDNANAVVEAAPRYQARLVEIYDSVLARFDIDGPDAMDQLLERVSLSAMLGSIASALGALVGNISLVLVYLFFLLFERMFAQTKFRALLPNDSLRDEVAQVLREIDRDVRMYLGVKTFVSLLTAGGAYIVMRSVGLDFPEFFAIIIFIFNFIPNIGSLVATILPTLLALVQFDGFRQLAIVGVGITAIQLVVANLIEPPLMGKSLNLSPLVVILSLVFWGTIWGVVGMFLCIPITVVLMIVLSRFPNARWIAIVLSKNGTVRGETVPSH